MKVTEDYYVPPDNTSNVFFFSWFYHHWSIFQGLALEQDTRWGAGDVWCHFCFIPETNRNDLKIIFSNWNFKDPLSLAIFIEKKKKIDSKQTRVDELENRKE